MLEPQRLDPVAASEAADRDSQTEALLLDGLDRYFAGRYDEAIHLWTRVLFLDRSHARARAYIDRARTALAERHRRAEEMLQASRELLEQGQTAAARRLLTEAVATSGDDEHASALRVRLERVERVRAADRPTEPIRPPRVEAVPGWSWPRRSRTVVTSVVLFAVAMLLVAGATSATVQDWVRLRSSATALRPAATSVKVPVLSSSDVALLRAQTLFDRGRLAEALQALDRVGSEGSVRTVADQLRIRIQQLLLASGRERTSASRLADPIRR